jgi:Domain of unknown function (DUF1707)
MLVYAADASSGGEAAMAEARDDEVPGTGDRGRLRAAHADRDRVIGVLTTAFVRGMLDKGEFDVRVSQTFASRTYAELAAVTADLPAAVPQAPGPAVREEGWLTMKRALIVSACLLAPTGLAALIGLVLAERYNDASLAVPPLLVFFVATVISGPLITEARNRVRSRARPPQAPARGAGGQSSRAPRSRPQRRPPDGGRTLAVTA